MTEHPDLDLAGIGIGPFNLGLAALLSRHTHKSAAFFERKPQFSWHQGLLLPGTTLQVPFLADLVTMADPTHPLSYLNYLHQHDRLYRFYYYDQFLIPRQEYDHYCRWAAQQLPACQFGSEVCDVGHDAARERFVVEVESQAGRSRWYSRDLAIGIGTRPWLPAWAENLTSENISHAADFSARQSQLSQRKSVTVMGSGQSAAECVLALLQGLTPEQVAAGASIQWVTRSVGFHPMEYSKLGQECFTPAYMDYFTALPRSQRRQLVTEQGLLYKGISASTIAAIYDLLYERSIAGAEPGLRLYSNCEVADAELLPGGAVRLHCRHRQLAQDCRLDCDAVVAATGYRHAWPHWFEHLKHSVLATDEHGDCLVDSDFIAQRQDGGRGRVFIQNAEVFQHGVGAPDLGIGAYRNAVIVNQLLGQAHYRIPATTAFQHYGLPPQ
ncbi:putative histamine N-monooxygenase [Isoalcanivorax beigongshangi]|uniref:Histamine N-monooxygenase n=1 Tax=Isoalcanivorax beigongshangi TaxID=3238810 RepID=A0ABV4AEV1_9GAMM